MKGKEKCRALKELRQKIAEENDIEYAVSECTHRGNCKGTCPKCEAELRYLERELERRVKLGRTVVLAGLSACLAGVVAGCDGNEEKKPWSDSNSGSTAYVEPELDGDVEEYEPLQPNGDTTEEIELEGMETDPLDDVTELDGDVSVIDYTDSTETGTISK